MPKRAADIVCAAVSTAVTFAERTITDVLGVRAKVRVQEDEARITLTLPAAYEQRGGSTSRPDRHDADV